MRTLKKSLLTACLFFIMTVFCFAAGSGPTWITPTYDAKMPDITIWKVSTKSVGTSTTGGPWPITLTYQNGFITDYKFNSSSTNLDVSIRNKSGSQASTAEELINNTSNNLVADCPNGTRRYFTTPNGALYIYFNNHDSTNATGVIKGYLITTVKPY